MSNNKNQKRNQNNNKNKEQKILILDSGPVISLSLSDLLFILKEIKNRFPEISFVISDNVIKEIIERPLTIKRFKLEALFVKKLFDEKIIEPSSVYVSDEKLEKSTNEVLNTSGRIFRAKGENIQILHEGEASSIALYKLLKEKYEKVLLIVDERTTRMLCESPKNLHKLLERKLHTLIEYDYEAADFFKDISIARSSELCSYAFKKGIIKLPSTKTENLDAVLYALKYHGCSISFEEIEQEKQIFNKV